MTLIEELQTIDGATSLFIYDDNGAFVTSPTAIATPEEGTQYAAGAATLNGLKMQARRDRLYPQ